MPTIRLYALAQQPRAQRPRLYLTDARRFVLAQPLTTDPAQAKVWVEKSGPYQFMRRHPELKRRFYVLDVELPASAVKIKRRNADAA